MRAAGEEMAYPVRHFGRGLREVGGRQPRGISGRYAHWVCGIVTVSGDGRGTAFLRVMGQSCALGRLFEYSSLVARARSTWRTVDIAHAESTEKSRCQPPQQWRRTPRACNVTGRLILRTDALTTPVGVRRMLAPAGTETM